MVDGGRQWVNAWPYPHASRIGVLLHPARPVLATSESAGTWDEGGIESKKSHLVHSHRPRALDPEEQHAFSPTVHI